jgi:hypothetical protein
MPVMRDEWGNLWDVLSEEVGDECPDCGGDHGGKSHYEHVALLRARGQYEPRLTAGADFVARERR